MSTRYRGPGQKYDLPESFLLYPAQTWPYKNHLALLEGLALLQEQYDMRPQLICTGRVDRDVWPQLARAINRFGLTDRVRFVGFVPDAEIRAFYRLALALVLPTLFEAVSFPIFEAWLDGLPVACSNVTSLPEQVGDAALVFEPQPPAIACALFELLSRADLRVQLAERGRVRLQLFTWAKTAKAYRAVYRRAAGRLLTHEDHELLERNWMLDPPPLDAGTSASGA